DEPEALETAQWPLADLCGLRAREDFSDARSLLATYLVAEKLGQK
ncbi:MAG: ADP compounds hydrolase NudE, partial [Acidiferrobacteraceae bacterium]|nr:ADP compounds hydrolase NudE [Acidiferrobacteraceae bacterium]MBT4394573.1 ADP compounds hydrolase NudE [Acidiferrobacteraceae bacterium]MBT4404235.1 ADP compounds hydrolase NudE [Acidiferrobacteraceae bacterium]MBT5621960.1 ADP compounds hydrolase NudE [Acidiferrobacteraceae bacterium]